MQVRQNPYEEYSFQDTTYRIPETIFSTSSHQGTGSWDSPSFTSAMRLRLFVFVGIFILFAICVVCRSRQEAADEEHGEWKELERDADILEALDEEVLEPGIAKGWDR